jgi:hypothetical protein
MTIKFTNNAISTLASGITNSDTSITVVSGGGTKFPSLTGGEYFRATLIDASNNLEIVKVTARSGNVLTVTRAQESTTARNFSTGDRIELRITAQSLLDAATTLTSLAADLDLNSNNITGTGAISCSGDLTVDTSTLKVDSTNNRVGIGTASPSKLLEVTSTDTGAFGVEVKLNHDSASPADNDTISIITSQGNNDAGEGINYSEIHTQVADVSDGTEDARLEFHLMRAGTLTENMRLEADGDLHVDGDVIAFSTTVSDVALKSDIEMIPNALDKIDEVRGVTFTRHNGQKSAGIIAQELEKVLPEAVREKELKLVDGKKYKTVEYDAIHGLLINCIKELKEEIKELKNAFSK